MSQSIYIDITQYDPFILGFLIPSIFLIVKYTQIGIPIKEMTMNVSKTIYSLLLYI